MYYVHLVVFCCNRVIHCICNLLHRQKEKQFIITVSCIGHLHLLSTYNLPHNLPVSFFSHMPEFSCHPISYKNKQSNNHKKLFLVGSSGQIIRNLQQWQQNLSAYKVNSKTDLPAGLKKIASEKGFRISDNQGSGNCMFYALSEQLEIIKGIKIQHAELRQFLVQYLRKNPKLVSWC